MLIENDVAETVMADEKAVYRVVAAINLSNEAITKYALRIIGNIVAVKDEYIVSFCKMNLLEILNAALRCSNG